MKKFFKISAVILALGILVIVVLLWIKHEPLPKGHSGPEAEALAQQMLIALNYETFEKTRYLEWSYRNGANQYLWDKQMGKVEVRWGDYIVNLDLVQLENSAVRENGKAVPSEKSEKLIQKALKHFNNDSFWLVAPYKVFDKGTQRSLVTLDDGTQGLMVTYTSGGTTPGDSYLWLLNENGFPNAYKMWVKIIPVGGLEASWDDWIISESGAFLPKSHKLGPVTLDMGNVKGYN